MGNVTDCWRNNNHLQAGKRSRTDKGGRRGVAVDSTPAVQKHVSSCERHLPEWARCEYTLIPGQWLMA